MMIISPALSQGVETKKDYTLYEQTMNSHEHCRAQLDIFVEKSAILLQTEPVYVKNERDIVNSKGNYSLRLHPNSLETMFFECKNKLLIISYKFS